MRLRFGSAAASRPYPGERRGRAFRAIGAGAAIEKLEGDALPCSRPARYALRAIHDVLPQHRPVFRLSAPTFAAQAPLFGKRARIRSGFEQMHTVPETALLSDPEVYEPEGRLKFGTTRRSSLQWERRFAPDARWVRRLL